MLAQTIFSHFRPLFALLPHYWSRKLKFEKNAKQNLEILSYYRCVPLIKIIWCMVPEIWSSTDIMFLSLYAFFCPFTSPPPLNSPKKNIWKKWKKHLEISSFYTTVPKIMIICYTVPEIWCVMDVIAIFHFGLCFSFLPPIFSNPKNEKFKTIKRKPWGIILRKCTKNNDHMLYCSWDIACVECNSFFHLGQFLALFPN